MIIEKKNIAVLILIIASTLTSCEEEAQISSKQVYIESIKGEWMINANSTVLLDDQDITYLFNDFKITINQDLTYTTNSVDLITQPNPWPAFGSFSINDELTRFTRDDDLPILIELKETGTFTFSFQFNGEFANSNGRIDALGGGDWFMELNKP